jgi:hypothetical protein
MGHDKSTNLSRSRQVATLNRGLRGRGHFGTQRVQTPGTRPRHRRVRSCFQWIKPLVSLRFGQIRDVFGALYELFGQHVRSLHEQLLVHKVFHNEQTSRGPFRFNFDVCGLRTLVSDRVLSPQGHSATTRSSCSWSNVASPDIYIYIYISDGTAPGFDAICACLYHHLL